MSINKEKMTQKLITMPKTMVDDIANYRFKNRIKTESEAIRRLIAKGLEAEEDSENKEENHMT